MKQTQRTGNQWFTGMTIIGSKKERMAKMVSNFNKMDLNEIITIPETKEEMQALNRFFVYYTREEATERVLTGLNYIIKTINEINLDLNKYLTRDAEDMRPDTMPTIIWALDKLASAPTTHMMKEYFPFINASDNAGEFLVYFWEFFQNAKEIIERIYDTRSMKVTDYKKTGFDARHNWKKFDEARKSTEEIVKITNEILTKRHEEFKKRELGIE